MRKDIHVFSGPPRTFDKVKINSYYTIFFDDGSHAVSIIKQSHNPGGVHLNLYDEPREYFPLYLAIRLIIHILPIGPNPIIIKASQITIRVNFTCQICLQTMQAMRKLEPTGFDTDSIHFHVPDYDKENWYCDRCRKFNVRAIIAGLDPGGSWLASTSRANDGAWSFPTGNPDRACSGASSRRPPRASRGRWPTPFVPRTPRPFEPATARW